MFRPTLKICLVGIPKSSTKAKLLRYMASTFDSDEFTLSIKLNKSGQNCGWATLETKNPHLYRSILKKKEFSLSGKSFFSRKFMDQNALESSRKDYEQRKVFVNKIPLEVSGLEFGEFFKKFGNLEESFIITSKKQRLRLNYGFLVYEKVEDAEYVANIKEINFDGSWLILSRFRNKRDMADKNEYETVNNYENKRKCKKKFSNRRRKNYNSRRSRFDQRFNNRWMRPRGWPESSGYHEREQLTRDGWNRNSTYRVHPFRGGAWHPRNAISSYRTETPMLDFNTKEAKSAIKAGKIWRHIDENHTLSNLRQNYFGSENRKRRNLVY